jgi:hypothetical protein
MQIREAMNDESQKHLFTGIVEADECYIGGKKKKGDKKKDDDDNFLNGGGRATDKQGVMGCVERETGKVKAHTQDKFTFVELKAFLAQHIDFDKAVRWNAKYWKFGILRWQNFMVSKW